MPALLALLGAWITAPTVAAPLTDVPTPASAGGRPSHGPADHKATGHVIVFTPHTGRVVIAEDADNDGVAEAIAVADNVTLSEGVPAYDGPGSVVRNEVGLAVVTDVPARKLVFHLLDVPKERVVAAPGAAVDLPQKWFAAVILDDSMEPMPLSTLDSAFKAGPVAACLPRCTWRLDHGATSCHAVCTQGCAACGQWQGSPRCACAPFRDQRDSVR